MMQNFFMRFLPLRAVLCRSTPGCAQRLGEIGPQILSRFQANMCAHSKLRDTEMRHPYGSGFVLYFEREGSACAGSIQEGLGRLSGSIADLRFFWVFYAAEMFKTYGPDPVGVSWRP
jgi:hypothetical protein